MNDLLKKLMAGLPQAEPQDMNENDPYLAPNVLPSPLMSPLESLQKENNDRIKMASFEPEEIKAQAPMPSKAIKPALPFTQPGEDVEIPQDVKKASSLEEVLANLPGQQKDNELADAQAANQDYIKAILLARAGNKIGSSIAGVKADDKYGQDFADLSNKKVTDLQDRRKSERDMENQNFQRRNQAISEHKSLFELGDKEKENDPNSDVSKAFRDYMRSYAKMANVPVNIDDRMSMSDLQKTTGMLGNIVSAKMAQDARKDNMMLMKSNKEELNKDKNERKNLDFAAQQHDRIIKSDAYKMTVAEEQYLSAKSALENPSGVKDIDVLYRTVRGFDPNSAVREGEIGLAQQGVSLKAKLSNMMSRLGDKPRVIPPEFIKGVLELAAMNKQLGEKQYKRHLSGVIKNAKARGMADVDMDMIDPLFGQTTESAPINAPAPQKTPVSQDDPRIDAFMKKNNVKDRNEAIKILKEHGKI